MLLEGRSHLTESSGDQSSAFWQSRLEDARLIKGSFNRKPTARVTVRNEETVRNTDARLVESQFGSPMKTLAESIAERSRLAVIIKERFQRSKQQLLINEDNKAYIQRIKNVLGNKQSGYQSRSFSPNHSPKPTEKSSFAGFSQRFGTEVSIKIRPSNRHQSFWATGLGQSMKTNAELPLSTNLTPKIKQTPGSPGMFSPTGKSVSISGVKGTPSTKKKSKIGLLIDSLINKENCRPNRQPASPVTEHKEVEKVDTRDESVLYYVVEGQIDRAFIQKFADVSAIIEGIACGFIGMSPSDMQTAVLKYIQACQHETVVKFEVLSCLLRPR